jgi:hypothetical protein
MDAAVARTYALFGKETLLVPVKNGRPAPDPSVNAAASSFSPSYQRLLGENDVAVITGARSNNLCALQFVTENGHLDFLAHNPSLAQSLTLISSGRIFVFFRVLDVVPDVDPNARNGLECSMVFNDKCVHVLCRRPRRPDEKITIRALFRPKLIRMQDINWNERTRELLLAAFIQHRQGPPAFRNGQRIQTNINFWADYFADQEHIRFVRTVGFVNSQTGARLTDEVVLQRLAGFLQEFAREDSYGYLRNERRPTRLRIMLEAMRIVALDDTGAADSIEEFFARGLEKDPESELSVDVLFEGFQAFCVKNALALVPRKTFLTRIKQMLRVRSSVGQSHSLPGNNVDPLLAFIGDDVSSQKVCSKFLRTLLQPIAAKYGIVFMVLHHTGKPSTDARARSQWTHSDFSHAALGSSELINWARAVVYLKRLRDGMYELMFTKRGGRAGAVNPDGTSTTSVQLQHSSGKIFWKQVSPVIVPAKKPGRKGFGFDAAVFASKHPELRDSGPADICRVVSAESGMKSRTFYNHWPRIRDAFASTPP